MKKKSLVKILIICMFALSMPLVTFAMTDAAINAMGGMAGATVTDGTGKLGAILNSVIGLIQVAGTGISMIMVTVLGIKYIMASPSDKADVKKQIVPLVIGAVILFASVNLVAIVANVADKTLKSASTGG